MEMPTKWLTVLLVSACTLLAHGQDNTQTRIPDYLIECYRNQSLRHPENRLPMNIETFIDMVRKVEKFQRDTVGIAELTTSILHRFRLDGIERSQDVQEAEGVLPFAVKGMPFYKHRLILKYLVPSNSYQFPNESLSKVELCTLHFMLSHSIDTTSRGDEQRVCGKLSNYESSNRIPRNARFRRQLEQEEEEANKQVSSSEEGEASEETPDTAAAEKIPAQHAEDTSQQVAGETDESEEAKDDDKADETQNQHQVEVVNQTASGNGTKTGNYIFDDDILPYNGPPQKERSVLDIEPESDDSAKPRVSVTTTESDCPVENGVVYAQWGTVSLGSVLAGLAAGLLPQQIRLPDLIRKPQLETNLPSVTVDNKFSATLVGDLAEAALEQGPKKRGGIKIGLAGGWNSTIIPRWYFHKEKEGRQMTDAEIRGGLDGLVLGTFITKWKQLAGGSELKLSQLLSMYYSEDGAFEPQYRACKRKDLYSEVAPSVTLQEETYGFTLVLDQQSISSASVSNEQMKTFTDTAVNALSSYLPGMEGESCVPTTITKRDTDSQRSSLHTNVTVIIDRSWGFSDIQALIYKLATKLELWEYGSRLTVLDGKNAAAFINDAMYSSDVIMNFTESEYNTHESGMDIPRLLEKELLTRMERLLQEESEKKLAGGRTTIIIFMPSTPVNLNDNDLTIARNQFNHFREYLPDVKFLYIAPGNKDNYKELVENPARDIITFVSVQTEAEKINLINTVTERIKLVPLRLFNPTCGSNWTGGEYSSAEFLHSVKPIGVAYHRLHPNYFYSAGSAQFTISNSNSQILDVCYSRKYEYPDNATSDVTCQKLQSGNVEIKLEDACEGSDYISQCLPLFISVRSDNTAPQARCKYDCVFPSNIDYTIRNQGLGCTAGVGHLLSNPQLMLLTAAFIFLLKNLNFGS